MREPEGIETALPGRSSERPWSKHREPDIRNVEAVVRIPSPPPGKAQVKGLKWDPEESPSVTCLGVELGRPHDLLSAQTLMTDGHALSPQDERGRLPVDAENCSARPVQGGARV